MIPTVADVLDYTRALIRDPDDWIQGAYAARHTVDGEAIPCNIEHADSFCLDGALLYARMTLAPGLPGVYMEAWKLVSDAIADVYPNIAITSHNKASARVKLNDSVGHKAVMMVLDIACARARRIEDQLFAIEQEVQQRAITTEQTPPVHVTEKG